MHLADGDRVLSGSASLRSLRNGFSPHACPQFTLRALMVAVLVVAAFFGGMAAQHKIDRQPVYHETMTFRDGSNWVRVADQPKPWPPMLRPVQPEVDVVVDARSGGV